jgi:hypothetical protein
VLPPEQFAMFSKLRQLRKDISHRDNVPPYALFTHEHRAARVTSGASMCLYVGRDGGAKVPAPSVDCGRQVC